MPPIADGKLTKNRFSLRKRSLRRRVLIALLLVFVLGFGNLAVHLYGTRDELRRTILAIQARAVSEDISTVDDVKRLPLTYAGGELSYTLYSADGQVQWLSANQDRPRRLRANTLERDSHWWRWSPIGGRVINVPVQLQDGHILMVTRNDVHERELIDDLLADRLRQSLVIMLPLGLLSVLAIIALLGWTLRPVKRAALLAREIGPDQPQRRIPLHDLPGEFHPLARAANSALDRLASAYAAERRFVADAAHELRTPLTVLDLRLQDARDSNQPDWPALDREMQQMRRMVGQLLELARQDGAVSEANLPPPTTRISRTAREAAAALLPLYETAGRTLLIEIEDGLHCQGTTNELHEALTNLLENALLHGAGDVTLTLYKAADKVILEVTDQGDGVTENEQESMFQRFRKGRQNSGGSGLGLAIVRRIVENAGGHVGFADGRPATLRVVLPRV